MTSVSNHKSLPTGGLPHSAKPAIDPVSFEQAAATVLGRLQHAMADLLAAAPEEVRKAADVERIFDIDHRLGWQVYRIATAREPMAAGTYVPARVSVERLIKAAARKGVAESVALEVNLAFEQFETLVKQHAGTRTDFDALISSAIPEEQHRMSLASREALFHAARNIRGVSMRTALLTHIIHPNVEFPELLDGCHLVGNFGLQRVRRGAMIETSALFRDQTGSKIRTIDGQPITESTDVMLPKFCSIPTPTIAVHRGERGARFVLEGEDVGIQAAADSVFADYLPAGRSRFAVPERPLIGAGHATDAPARWQVIDLLVADGVVPTQEPDVQVYDIVPHGQLIKVPDPDRDLDRVAFQPTARSLGRGVDRFRCLQVPRYQEMLKFICESRSWNPASFHGYRVEIEYPAYSWQTVLTLRLPFRT